jgi:S-adenosylmethionine:tRNA ribosyltransferase-isomerase
VKLKDFNFKLPEERVARFPAQKRDESKLMVVDRKKGRISHHRFKDMVQLTGEDDFLVVNNSRVIPARLFGKIDARDVDILIVRSIDETTAEALTLPARKFKPGTRVILDFDGYELWAEVIGIGHRGKRTLRFNKKLPEVLKTGYAPLPPYIKRKFAEAEKFKKLDLQRYQTIYSKDPGSIAAPTAGLHFTGALLTEIKKKCEVIEVTLDVGEATFQKIEVDDIREHQMGREFITIKKEKIERIEKQKQSKNLIAVGTTTVRSLETYALKRPRQERFYSELFIFPGFEFKMMDKLITNFHLPESSLFILVSAFAGLELMKEAYQIAIEKDYHFFSYGDAMFIV